MDYGNNHGVLFISNRKYHVSFKKFDSLMRNLNVEYHNDLF